MPALPRRLALTLALASGGLLAAGGHGCGGGGGPGATLGRDEWLAASARLGACAPGFATALDLTAAAERSAADLAALPVPLRDAARCANAAAGDCAAIFACFAGLDAPPSPCDPAAAPACLSATLAWSCVGTVSMATDCAGADEACVTVTGAGLVSGCGIAACAAADAPTCDGERIVRCSAGVSRPEACAPGARCSSDAGGAQCSGRGAPCPPGTAPSCKDATTLVTCIGGAEAESDCAEGGWERVCAMGATSPTCLPAHAECDPATFVDRCNGARLEYCRDGRVRGLDCGALGFDSCSLGDPSRGVPSRCAPPGGGNSDAGPPDATPADADLPDAA